MYHPFSDIPEIAALSASRGLVRIPMEQDVPFTPRVRALVDTEEFQRLRHVTQLGLAAQVYPGANHTRFEHALGVFNNAIRYLWQLGRDPRFCAIIDHHMAEVLLVSSLLHDLGHWGGHTLGRTHLEHQMQVGLARIAPRDGLCLSLAHA